MPQVAPLAEWPEYTSKERHRIQVLINQRDHLVSLEPDSASVLKRIEAFNWMLDSLAHDDAEFSEDFFYILRDRRNYIETIPDEEMNGFLGAEARAIDWAMEELLPGSGHKAFWSKVKPYLVYAPNLEWGTFEAGVVIAESAEEAIDIVRASDPKLYPGRNHPLEVYLNSTNGDEIELVAREVSLRKGLIYHHNL
jgi:hypothetical protein